MKQQIYTLISSVTITAMMTVLLSCENQTYDFECSDDAIASCRKKLANLRKVDTLPTKVLSDEISDWLVLQDSTYSIIFRDSLNEDQHLAETLMTISDSIHDEMKRLVFSQSRTMADFVYLKIHTIQDKEKTQKSVGYKTAREFYENLNEDVFPDKRITLINYRRLLKSKPFKNETEMYSFVKEEDKCFRSFLRFLSEISQEELNEISAGTARYFDALTEAVSKDLDNDRNRNIAIFLTIRLNRRIIQNALACASDIRNKVKLTEGRALDYRWMIIQPFFSMDNYAMELLDENETYSLEELAKEAPELLLQLDKSLDPDNQQNVNDLTKTMVDYFLNTYVEFTL